METVKERENKRWKGSRWRGGEGYEEEIRKEK